MARTGRPRSFDRNEAVISAMHLFWAHGFEAVSLDQLRRAMGGISSASFYAAFGSKEALYRETLDLYVRTHRAVTMALFDNSLPPRDRLEQTLRRSAAMQTDPSHPAGCMIAFSGTVFSDASVQAAAADIRAAGREAIYACVEAGIADGILRPGTDVAGLAALFEGLLMGLSIQARDGVKARVIDNAISQALKAWDANREPALMERRS
jgi:TetR/AcrR family transcriptional repressor for divergent bdcA